MILKTIQAIFETTRLIIQARRNGFKGGFILMSEEDYKAMQEERSEIFNNGLLMWNAIVDMIHGRSACNYCMFAPCADQNDTGCADWCLRDLTEEERANGVKERKVSREESQ